MDKLKELEKKLFKYKQKHFISNDKKNRSFDTGFFVISELLAGIGVGGFFGYYLDQYFNTKVLFLLFFLILGLISAFYNIYNKYK